MWETELRKEGLEEQMRKMDAVKVIGPDTVPGQVLEECQQ